MSELEVTTLEVTLDDSADYKIKFVDEPERPLGFNCDALVPRRLSCDPVVEFGYRINDPEYDQPHPIVEKIEDALRLDAPDGSTIIRLFFGTYESIAKRIDGEWMMTELAEASVIGRFEYDKHLPSVNAEYIPVRAGRSARKTLSTYGRNFKEQTKDQVIHTEIQGWLEKVSPLMRDRIRLQVEMVQLFSNQFNRRDTTNMVKLPEDAICDYIGINDSWNYKVASEKFMNTVDGERLFVKITAVNII